jgi:hypothetical protein
MRLTLAAARTQRKFQVWRSFFKGFRVSFSLAHVADWTSLCAPLPSCVRSGEGIVSRGLFMLTLERPERAARVWRPIAQENYMLVSGQWSISFSVRIAIIILSFMLPSRRPVPHVTLTFSPLLLSRPISPYPPQCLHPSAPYLLPSPSPSSYCLFRSLIASPSQTCLPHIPPPPPLPSHLISVMGQLSLLQHINIAVSFTLYLYHRMLTSADYPLVFFR